MTDPIDRPYLESLEPAAQPEGVDVPGPQSAWADLINYGTYNGNFRQGPPQSASNIDVATSISGSNFIPGWRFVQSSNTSITARIVKGSAAGSGSNLRFTHDATLTTATSYIEQIVDVGGSVVGDVGATVRVEYQGVSGDWVLGIARQYLAHDGSIIGMPPEFRAEVPVAATATPLSADGDQSEDPAPRNARYLRYRVYGRSSDANAVLDLYGIRRERGMMYAQLFDTSRTTNGVYNLLMRGSNLYVAPTSATQFGGFSGTGKRLLNWQLVPLPFSLVSIPANATTQMQMWGDTALALTTPRIGPPWPGSIVGVSYRLSAAPTAGGATALRIQATVAGVSVWTAHTLAGSGAAVSGEVSQAVQLDEFTTGQQLGLQVVTSSTYAPTTADLACVLWVALKYDGD